jgi:glycosyltransferase involved in cell wall biosynthesis
VKKIGGISVHSYPAVKFRSYPEFKIAVPRGRDRTPELDIVHTHSPFTMGFFGWRVAKFQKIPRVSTFHTLLSEYTRHVSRFGKPILKLITWRFCKIFYNRHKRLIAPSKTLKKILREHGIKKPVEVIPNGIDTNFYRPTDRRKARRKLGLKDGRIFLCLGRVSYEKNLDLVIRAIRNVRASMLIVGRGPALKGLKALAKKEKLYGKVFFKGFIPEETKPLYYSAADALVNASTSETQGMVILESMACGCPVIGAKSLAIPELVKEGKNGYLFEPGSTGELVEILKTFQPSERLKAHAVRTAQKFSIEKCTEKLEKFYASIK